MPLSLPSGGVRRELAALEAAQVLDPIDVHFAESLAVLGDEQRLDVLLAAALVSRQSREGHVCVRLDGVAGSPILPRNNPVEADEAVSAAGELGAWPELHSWLSELRSSPLVTSSVARGPLVLDAEGRLYLYRYYEHEQRLLTLLEDRASGAFPELDPGRVQRALRRLFGTSPDAPLNDQELSVLVALVQRFAIISGGPGTGKTTTVARLLALIVELELEAGRPPPRMLLLAPTGKAAGRLVESIQKAKVGLRTSPEVLLAVPEQASTIHRALGMRPQTGRFAHDAERPLICDLVLVDEASMVDLALMRQLVQAVPRGARLVLLGDRNQLASVEAGSVLGELVAAAGGSSGQRRYSQKLCDHVKLLTGRTLPSAKTVSWLSDHVVELTKSYRFDEQSPIGRLALAVRTGDVKTTLAVLEEGDEVSWIPEAATEELSKTLASVVVRGFRPIFKAESPEGALAALARFRVLCAHRRGFAGVEHQNERITRALTRAGLVTERGALFSGCPLLITQNDYAVRLFNGDVGLAWGEPEGLRIHFETVAASGGTSVTRALSPARLPAYERAFALSIHKSQGSEHDEVAIVLPDADSPLLSRELLYTAITRARRRISLFATREAIVQAVERPIARASGLADAIVAKSRSDGEERR